MEVPYYIGWHAFHSSRNITKRRIVAVLFNVLHHFNKYLRKATVVWTGDRGWQFIWPLRCSCWIKITDEVSAIAKVSLFISSVCSICPPRFFYRNLQNCLVPIVTSMTGTAKSTRCTVWKRSYQWYQRDCVYAIENTKKGIITDVFIFRKSFVRNWVLMLKTENSVVDTGLIGDFLIIRQFLFNMDVKSCT